MDFSGLTDDQLVGLIRAACAEAVGRGEAVKAAAESAALSEAEKAEIGRDATQREKERLRREEAERVAAAAAEAARADDDRARLRSNREKQQRLWGKKKGIANLVIAVLGKGWHVKVWLRDNEQRVYLDGYDGRAAVFYATGNGTHPPQTLRCSHLPKDVRPYILQISKRAASDWTQVGINCDEAAEYSGPAASAVPEEWVRMGERLRERESVEQLEARASRLQTKIDGLFEKAEAEAREVAAAEKRRLQGLYLGTYQETQLIANRTNMSRYAQEAVDLRPESDQAKATADAARAAFSLRFPSENAKKNK